MATKTIGLYYCNHCKDIDKYIVTEKVTIADCRACGQKVKVYESVFFAKSLMNKFMTNARELQALQNQELAEHDEDYNDEDVKESTSEINPLSSVKLSQTDVLATEKQHQPLKNWFNQRRVIPTFDYSAVDMSGYYDEASEKIGENYNVFKDILKKVAWSYGKNHTGLNIDLTKYSQKDAQIISSICRTFYSHSLFTKYVYNKKDKNIHLKLQKAAPVKQFLIGVWLEWFALNTVLHFVKKQGDNYKFSCARGVKIKFSNEDAYELDVVFVTTKSEPLVIECKTGEFRQDIDKFLSIQKRLKIPAKNYIVLSSTLTVSQAKSLTGMYGITFLSINMFAEFIQTVLGE